MARGHAVLVAVLVLAGWLGLPCVARADSTRIALRTSITAASVDRPSAVTLGEIADVSGLDAQRLSAVVVGDIAKASKGGIPTLTISMSDVRAALDDAGVNWGRIELSGSECRVSLPAKASVVAPRRARNEAETRVPQHVDLSGPATLRTQIARRIASMLNIDNDDLRLQFDEQDEALLDQPVGSRRVDLQPAASAASGRVPMNITMYEGDRVVLTHLVSAGVLVRRPVATATEIIDRGTPITPGQVEITPRWVSPAVKPSASTEQLAGAVANVRFQPGQVIGASDVSQPVVCKRGDVVYVHALSGGITIKAKARAVSAARDGEMVQLKLDGSDKVFSARMSGAGRAVLLVAPGGSLDDAQPASSTPVVGSPEPKTAKPRRNLHTKVKP